eukprot:4589056-Amphidinium_carterae.1
MERVIEDLSHETFAAQEFLLTRWVADCGSLLTSHLESWSQLDRRTVMASPSSPVLSYAHFEHHSLLNQTRFTLFTRAVSYTHLTLPTILLV